MVLHNLDWDLLILNHHFDFGYFYDLYLLLRDHYLLFNLYHFWWQLHYLLDCHYFFENLWDLNDSISISNELNYLLMGFWYNLILSNKNRIVLFNDLINGLLHQFFLDDWHSNCSFSLNHLFYNFFHNYFNRLDDFLYRFNVSHIVFLNLSDLELFLNHYPFLSRNLNWSIFFHNHLHLGRHFHRFRLFYNLVDWHLPILCIYDRLLNIVSGLHRNLLRELDWELLSKRHSYLVVNDFSFVQREYVCSWLLNHVFFRNSNNVINHFLDILRYLYYLRNGPEHVDDSINLFKFKLKDLSLDHSENPFVQLYIQVM